MSTPSGIRRAGGEQSAGAGLWLALLAGLALKAVIVATGSVTLHGDEGIIGLMARHILRGSWPVFFYGQYYMGALDAYLTAGAFLILGETELAIRVVQAALYAGTLVTTCLLAWRLSRDRFAALAAGLLMAIPPVMVSTYTTSTLGNYGETLLLGNLLLLLGWDILSGRRDSPGRWLLAGVLAGLGWWGMALIVTTLLPLALLILWRLRRTLPWGRLGLLALGFALGAAPWLITVLQAPGALLGDLFGVRFGQMLAGATPLPGPVTRLISLLLFNLPALFGLRPPWALEWTLLPLGLLAAAFYLLALWQAGRRALSRREPDESRLPLITLVGGWLALLAVFVLSPFGNDPSGRYLLPLYPLLAVLSGDWLARIRRGAARGGRLAGSGAEVAAQASRPGQPPVALSPSPSNGEGEGEPQSGSEGGEAARQARRWIPAAILALILAFNLWGNVAAMLRNPPGLTTQFNLTTHNPPDHDDDLIAFLDAQGVDRGYSNYWVAYRFAFLTGERIILAPRLPYKPDLSYSDRDDRYPLYTEMARAAEEVVFVTSQLPELDAALREGFAVQGVTFRERAIGPYVVFYDLSRPVSPEEVLPPGEEKGEP